jgi:transposase InsO family protein
MAPQGGDQEEVEKPEPVYFRQVFLNVFLPVRMVHQRGANREKVPFPITADAKNDTWQCDLLDFPDYVRANRGYRYVFTCVDVFTRRCIGLEPLKSKEEKPLLDTLKKLILQEGDAPRVLSSDNESGLLASSVQEFLKKADIQHVTSYPGDNRTQGIAEGFNHTIRRKVERYLDAYDTVKYVDILPRAERCIQRDPEQAFGRCPE